MEYLNQSIIPNIKINDNGNTYLEKTTSKKVFKCASVSEKMSGLYLSEFNQRFHNEHYDSKYIYNKLANPMLEFFNKFVDKNLQKHDYIFYITLSLKKQYFLFNKIFMFCHENNRESDSYSLMTSIIYNLCVTKFLDVRVSEPIKLFRCIKFKIPILKTRLFLCI